ncbi:edem3 [Symbiodinium necroappetens]|uniref:alpha-1,2-Mannosidase n=2 Tax=Symbiodinium TaxID=2949 RepID=A0A813AX40_9DINO|nr:ER degradation-enhancing alpha-mannosidase-like protein 3 [Symbiodinium microadriaticum]CAE7736293.1 edem3 [Symbiodinium microadriaticum]CAE7881518.1 edem3 [Symbiodinium necroappetens]
MGWRCLFALPLVAADAVPRHERVAAAEKVQDMYKHAFDSYMSHAFPADELRPLSCDGRLRRERGDLDAMLGNYSMTLIDSLDSLVIFKRKTAFKVAVSYIDDNVHFGKDLEVSTFEVNIRILGGLLSGHLHAQKILPKYAGGLLEKELSSYESH